LEGSSGSKRGEEGVMDRDDPLTDREDTIFMEGSIEQRIKGVWMHSSATMQDALVPSHSFISKIEELSTEGLACDWPMFDEVGIILNRASHCARRHHLASPTSDGITIRSTRVTENLGIRAEYGH
jgi:hypothetical protein